MVNAELIFEAYINAAIPYIDMTWLYDPIIHRWALLIKNQSNETLYFKLFNAIPNWDFGTSLPGSDEKELGAISAGGSKYYNIDMVREIPVGETYDNGNFTLKVYTDAGYTHEIASVDKEVTIDIQDIENWINVTIYDFPYEEEACDTQGWTLSGFSCNQTKSVEAGGCSLEKTEFVPAIPGCYSFYASRYIDIPDSSKVSLSFFYWFYIANVSGGYVQVLLDDELVFYVPIRASFPIVDKWAKFSVNLSPYKGQSKTIKIDFQLCKSTAPSGTWMYAYLDRIVIAGKD